MGKLNSKIALVTGAASGIGRDICYRFLEEDCVVIAADIDASALDALKNEAPHKGLKLHVILCDISKERELETLISHAIKEHGHIDILVNNAGIMDNFEAVADVTNSQWDRIMNVNLRGPFMLMRLLIPHFLHHKYGNIINVSSIGGLQGARAGAAYTASKFALNGLTKNTGYLYAEKGIRCNAVAPGAIETHIGDSIDYTKVSKDMNELMLAGLKLNPRMGKPKEIADIVLFLASEESSMINGEVLVADAAWSAY
jgi:NAD(P)-dependent dehydrogenase (short-subunit alcohol dehydrogenase family)